MIVAELFASQRQRFVSDASSVLLMPSRGMGFS